MCDLPCGSGDAGGHLGSCAVAGAPWSMTELGEYSLQGRIWESLSAESLQAAPLQVLSTTLSRSSLYLPIAGQMFPNNALHAAGPSCGALMLSVLSGPLSTALLLGYPPATCRLTGNLVL